MARAERYEEAIRLFVETAGDDELRQLVKSLGDVGDIADGVGREASAALDGVAQAAERIAKVEAFVKLKREAADTEAQLAAAQDAAQKLFRELSQGDGGSERLTRAQSAAAKSVNDLSQAALRQRQQLQAMRGELAGVGIDTRQLGTAQGQLRQQMATAREALSRSVDAVRQYRAESGRAADAVPRDNREIAKSYGLIERSLGRLRGVAAGALAYLGFNEAAQGIRNLADVAAQSENARRALQNLYGSQEDGNRAFESLRRLAKESGLAFDDVVESAKKLKAFGLDPLNGSYQALINQNAAVGGSNEDLQGKVLALGQAWAKQKLQGEEILQLVERGVPVWDLLQKSTGKNVQELQKLSEQGKLGREVIRGLYEEIGRANEGKANAALTSTSGLMAQLTARWTEFKQKIVDAGLGDYFKQQMQSLLASTGGLDGLARKVSASIVGTLEALKSLGQQIALIAQPIGAAGLALARHADAVVLLGKAYLGVKLAKWAGDLMAITQAQRAATAATVAATAAESARAGGISRLGGLLASIPRALTVTFAVIGLDVLLNGVNKINEGLKAQQEAVQASNRLQLAQRDLQGELLRLGQQQQSLYRDYAGTVVQSGQQISAMTREQAGQYRFALDQAREYFAGLIREARASGDAQAEATATERWKALGEAVTATKERIADLDRTAAAATGLRQFATKAVEEFDKLITKGKSAKEATADIFKGIDFGSEKGVASALDILDQVGARGTAAAAAIRSELRAALTQVTASDLPRLQEAAKAAFSEGSAAAKVFGEEVGRINLNRLGVDVDAIKTGFTAAGRSAVDAFKGAVTEVDKLGLNVQQRSAAIAQAFDNAFKQASTSAELQALKKALQDALSSGDIGFKEFQARVAETDAKLAELGGTASKMGEDVARGASSAASALDQVASAAAGTAATTSEAGKATETASQQMQVGGKAGKQYALTLYEVSDSANEAYRAITRMQTGIGDSDGRFVRGMNDLTARINNQGDAIAEEVRKLQAANAEFDELAARRKELSQKFDLLGAGEIEKLLQAEQQLEANRKRAAEKRKAEAAAVAPSADPVQVATAGREVAGAADSVGQMLRRTQEAANALSAASARVQSATGEFVIRVVSEAPPGGLAMLLKPGDLDRIASEVVRRIRLSKGSSN